MSAHQQDLVRLIKQKNTEVCLEDADTVIAKLGPRELADIFVDLTFLGTAVKFVQDQVWLKEQAATQEVHLAPLVKKFFDGELEPLLFFHPTLERAKIPDLAQFLKNAHALHLKIVGVIAHMPYPENKIFAETALRLMSDLFEFENQLQLEKSEKGLRLDFSLYRAFDSLDDIFHLDYALESCASSARAQTERLYESSGVGVQSSYVTLLMMLRYLKISKGAGFIDLGSGFGRVGLVLGLMRPDLRFQGYEFVNHRVDAANVIAKNLGIEQHVHFYTQDLSAHDFQIPVAEVYYMYDPFTEETYRHVLAQLAKIGSKKKITLITKGDAKKRLREAGQKGNWSAPQEFQNGNFCFFRSMGKG